MFSIQLIRSKLYDWRRARAQVVDFRSYTTNVPFGLLQEKLKLSSPRWNLYQERRRGVTGELLPVAEMQGRIHHQEVYKVRSNYKVLPEAFVGFVGHSNDPDEFIADVPLNTTFRVFIIEKPHGDSSITFPTFEAVTPHTRAGLRGKIDSQGILTVTDIILNGRRAPHNSWWPQRGIIRVINVIAELVDQIESGSPYDPIKAQRTAWNRSVRLPRPVPPFYSPLRRKSPPQMPKPK